MLEKRNPTPINIACIERGTLLKQQILESLSGSEVQVVQEKNMDQLLELLDEEVVDVVVVSSSAVRDAHSDWLEFVEVLSAKSPWTQVIFLIMPREIALAAKALKAGSFHYAKLPISNEELSLLIGAALANRPLIEPHLPSGERRQTRFEDMVGASTRMKEVYRLIRQAAATDIPVLVTGETGTGKDLAARAIHQLSDRSSQPFLPVHLGALPQELVPGELFGHEKGAFTGASEMRLGSFEQAHRGTVFLDEISTIDYRVQVSLLRLLETKEFHRIGGRKNIKADVRIIGATNENLEEAVRRGDFREDLYYRLEVFQISMPPLRERAGDLHLLVEDFLKRYSKQYGKNILGLSPDSVAALQSYDWPGNVRELKNVIHRAVVVCTGEVITPDHLSNRIKKSPRSTRSVVLKVGSTFEDAERELLHHTLKATGNNRCQAAALLGVSRGTLYNKIRKYKL